MDQQGGCRCAEEYAARWPAMAESELAGVHDPVCRVRLERLDAAGRRSSRILRR